MFEDAASKQTNYYEAGLLVFHKQVYTFIYDAFKEINSLINAVNFIKRNGQRSFMLITSCVSDCTSLRFCGNTTVKIFNSSEQTKVLVSMRT